MVKVQPYLQIPAVVHVEFGEASPVTSKLEKGQKYRARRTGADFTILSEPFETPIGTIRIVYWDHTNARLEYINPSSFEENGYALVVEPKYKIGDVVTDNEEPLTVEGVSKAPDHKGDFVYLVRDENGLVFAYEEERIEGKVSS